MVQQHYKRGGRQIDYNAYIKRLETIDMEYENIRIDTTDISKIAQNTGMPEWKISRIRIMYFLMSIYLMQE